jgi:hypothetical protein
MLGPALRAIPLGANPEKCRKIGAAARSQDEALGMLWHLARALRPLASESPRRRAGDP